MLTTLNVIKACGYTGKYFIVLSDDDDTIDEYIKNYGKENILIFNKKEIGKIVDRVDNFENYATALYARQFCIEYCMNNNIKYYWVLDDDCTGVRFRYEKDGKLLSRPVKMLDDVINSVVKFLKISNIDVLSLSISGAYIGGINSKAYSKKLYRDCVNNYFQKNESYFKWSGAVFEDEATQRMLGKIGKNFFSIGGICLDVGGYGSNEGGYKETYDKLSVYNRIFYSAIVSPSSWTRRYQNGKFIRKVRDEYIFPKILSDKYKKVIK